MARLEDIPKKPFFTAPEDYFDKLPAKIQSRIAEADKHGQRSVVIRYALQYALPLVVIAAAFVYYHSGNPDAETILASVEAEELINYLQETGMSTDEVLESVEFTDEELEALENELYDLSFQSIEMLEVN